MEPAPGTSPGVQSPESDNSALFLRNNNDLGVNTPISVATDATNQTRVSALVYSQKEYTVNLEWRNLHLRVPAKVARGQPKVLKDVLRDVSGKLAVGAITAIMGPTGCGKTSLLNCLAGRVTFIKGAELTGQLLVNGEIRHEEYFKRHSAYVTQDDYLYAFLTVKETLSMAARFYLAGTMNAEKREKQVEAVISELGLGKSRDTLVGDARVRGVSGGERKRVSVGCELISDPSILFLDEPTSGLDSFQALSVMTVLKDLASNGRSVVASVHQPRSSIFALFDHLILLSEGRTIFNGSAGEASAYFAANGYKCPGHFNPADFFLDVVSMDYRSTELEEKTRHRITRLADKWDGLQGPRMSELAGQEVPMQKVPKSDKSRLLCLGGEQYASSWCTQFGLLLGRAVRITLRNKIALVIKTFMSCFFALLLSAIYSDIGLSQKSIQDRSGVLFFVAINQVFGSVIGVIQTFPMEKAIVMRERAAKSYRVSAYFLSKLIAETPSNMIGPILFSIILYFAIGLYPSASRFFFFMLTCIMEGLAGVAIGLCISAFAPSADAAQAMAPPIVVIFLLFGGFYINVENLPLGARWVPQISLVKWAFQSLAINEFTGRTFECPSNSLSCITTGQQVLDRLSYGSTDKWVCIAALAGLTVGFNLLAYLILRFNGTRYMSVTKASAKKVRSPALV